MEISRESLIKLYIEEKKSQKQIAAELDIKQYEVQNALVKHEISRKKYKENTMPKNHNKGWTEEQKEFLIDNFGKISYSAIADSKIIQKKPSSVEHMRRRLKLGDSKKTDEYISISFLSRHLNVDWKTVNKWVEKYGLKCITKNITNKMPITRIKLSDFWTWAKKHTELIKWNKFKVAALGIEPQWTNEARKKFRETHPEREGLTWTNEEDKLLEAYRGIGLTMAEIGANMKRSGQAVDARLNVIASKRKTKKMWDEKEVAKLKKFVKMGLTSKQIAEKLETTSSKVDGARERHILKSKRGIKA